MKHLLFAALLIAFIPMSAQAQVFIGNSYVPDVGSLGCGCDEEYVVPSVEFFGPPAPAFDQAYYVAPRRYYYRPRYAYRPYPYYRPYRYRYY